MSCGGTREPVAMRKLCFAICLTNLIVMGCAAADELSGPGRRTLVSEEWGTIFCQESATVKSDVAGRSHRLNTDKGLVSMSRSIDGWLVQAPNQNLRLRRQDGLDGSTRLLVTFNSTSYVFERRNNDYMWMFPGNKVFFTLREGELRAALGPEGAFKMHKKNGGVAYDIDSDAGQSQVLLGRKKLNKAAGYRYVVVKQSGEDLGRHPYLVRGVVFENGPVGMFIKMPKNPVMDALDWNLVKAIPSTVPFPEPKVVEIRDKRDPLQAVEGTDNEDPLGLKRIKSEQYRDMKNPETPPTPNTNGNSTQWNTVPK